MVSTSDKTGMARISLPPELWACVLPHLDMHDVRQRAGAVKLCTSRILGRGWGDLVGTEIRNRVEQLMEHFFPGEGLKVLQQMDDLGVSISGSSVVRIATDWSALIHNKPLRDLDLYLSGEGDLTGEGDYIHTHKRKIALRQLLKSRKYDVFASYERHLSYGIEGVNTVKKYRHPDTEKEIDVIDCDEAPSAVIKRFHSTVVQNWIRRGQLVSRYPDIMNTHGNIFVRDLDGNEEHNEGRLNAIREKWALYGFPFMAGPVHAARPKHLEFSL